jgi:hypothetical protein
MVERDGRTKAKSSMKAVGRWEFKMCKTGSKMRRKIKGDSGHPCLAPLEARRGVGSPGRNRKPAWERWSTSCNTWLGTPAFRRMLIITGKGVLEKALLISNKSRNLGPFSWCKSSWTRRVADAVVRPGRPPYWWGWMWGRIDESKNFFR